MTVFEVTRILAELNECMNAQCAIIEGLVDRVSSLEECARVVSNEGPRGADDFNSKVEDVVRDNPFV